MSGKGRPDISIVIVTFNNEADIGACLMSVAAQTHEIPCEIIIIDNASTDATCAIIESLSTASGKEAVEFKFERNPDNRWFTRALNQGLKRATGELIVILNPDTIVHDRCLTILRQELYSSTQIAVTSPQFHNRDGTIQPSCRRFPRHRDVLFEITGLSRMFSNSARFNAWKMGDFGHRTRSEVDQPQGAFLMFRRDLLDEVGLWNERFPMFFSDVEWCHRVKQAGYEIIFQPKASITHQRGRSVLQRRITMIWSSSSSFYRYLKETRPGFPYWPANAIIGILLFLSACGRTIGIGLRGLFSNDNSPLVSRSFAFNGDLCKARLK